MKAKSNTQRMADFYSANGGEQFMVSVYRDEAVIYAQVKESTAKKLSERFCMLPNSVQVEDAALSFDGLTYCWWLKWSKLTSAPRQDWLALILTQVRMIVAVHAKNLLGSDNEIKYTDNQRLDANSVEAFVNSLPEIDYPKEV